MYISESTKGKKTVNFLDIIFICCAILAPPIPFVILFSSIYYQFDPFYFILGDSFGDPHFERVSTSVHLLCLASRICSACCGFECVRQLSFALLMFFQVQDVLQLQCCDLINLKILNVVQLEASLLEFRKVSLASVITRPPLEELLGIFITGAFWECVVLSSVLIKAYLLVPFFMYIITIFVWILSFFGLIIDLTILSRFCGNARLLTERLKSETNLMHCKYWVIGERKKQLVLKKMSKSFMVFRMYYYPLLPIDEQFCKDAARNLFERIFDAVLIFE